jgi:hypothetical protein
MEGEHEEQKRIVEGLAALWASLAKRKGVGGVVGSG